MDDNLQLWSFYRESLNIFYKIFDTVRQIDSCSFFSFLVDLDWLAFDDLRSRFQDQRSNLASYTSHDDARHTHTYTHTRSLVSLWTSSYRLANVHIAILSHPLRHSATYSSSVLTFLYVSLSSLFVQCALGTDWRFPLDESIDLLLFQIDPFLFLFFFFFSPTLMSTERNVQISTFADKIILQISIAITRSIDRQSALETSYLTDRSFVATKLKRAHVKVEERGGGGGGGEGLERKIKSIRWTVLVHR